MRKLFLIFLLLTGQVLIVCGQKRSPKLILTVPVSENTFMLCVEVTVGQWIEFIAANNYDEALFPDTSITRRMWYGLLFDDLRKKSSFSYLQAAKTSGHFKMYETPIDFRTKNFADSLQKEKGSPMLLPITGISFTQAQRFCQWKETYANASIEDGKSITIKLPGIELYKSVIQNVDSFCTGKCDSCNKYLFNYAHTKCTGGKPKKYYWSQGSELIRTDAYWPTDLGLYCLQGNAAEMTDEEGVAMGGSYNQYARESYNDHFQNYTKPEPWLGFRYIVVYQ